MAINGICEACHERQKTTFGGVIFYCDHNSTIAYKAPGQQSYLIVTDYTPQQFKALTDEIRSNFNTAVYGSPLTTIN